MTSVPARKKAWEDHLRDYGPPPPTMPASVWKKRINVASVVPGAPAADVQAILRKEDNCAAAAAAHQFVSRKKTKDLNRNRGVVELCCGETADSAKTKSAGDAKSSGLLRSTTRGPRVVSTSPSMRSTPSMVPSCSGLLCPASVVLLETG